MPSIATIAFTVSILGLLLTVIGVSITYFHRQLIPSIDVPPPFGPMQDSVSSNEGFRWIRIEKPTRFLGIDARNPSGTVWSGFTIGVSREKDEVAIFNMHITGERHGVHHYYWRGGPKSQPAEWDAGHTSPAWREGNNSPEILERSALLHAAHQIGRSIISDYSPVRIELKTAAGENGNDAIAIVMFHKDSGRNIIYNEESGFSLEPITIPNAPPIYSNGIYLLGMLSHIQDEIGEHWRNMIEVAVVSTHGDALTWADISFDSPTGYSYKQEYMPNNIDSYFSVTIPSYIQEIDILVSRGGYSSVRATIPIGFRVLVVLEPGSSNNTMTVAPIIGRPQSPNR